MKNTKWNDQFEVEGEKLVKKQSDVPYRYLTPDFKFTSNYKKAKYVNDGVYYRNKGGALQGDITGGFKTKDEAKQFYQDNKMGSDGYDMAYPPYYKELNSKWYNLANLVQNEIDGVELY